MNSYSQIYGVSPENVTETTSTFMLNILIRDTIPKQAADAEQSSTPFFADEHKLNQDIRRQIRRREIHGAGPRRYSAKY